MIRVDRNVIYPVTLIVDVLIPNLIEICEMTLEMKDSNRHKHTHTHTHTHTVFQLYSYLMQFVNIHI
jgi:hypothetical protein